VRRDDDAMRAEVERGLRTLNAMLRAHRAASLDPYVRDVGPGNALAVRVGYGDGDQVADGRFAEAYELPRGTLVGWFLSERRQSFLMPQERLASILGGRDTVLAGEELLLRARADLDAGRPREAALQARIALEALLAELASGGRDTGELGDHRPAIGAAANAALAGDPSADDTAAVTAAVDAMERALRHRAAGT
jgi:hypothetical protein